MDSYNSDNRNNSVKSIRYASGTIKIDENMCTMEYDLLYWAYFVPNDFNNKVINIIGEAGFDPVYEKNKIAFDYYPEDDLVICKISNYRITIVFEETFNKYKEHVIYRSGDSVIGIKDVLASSKEQKEENRALPWIRYPRTKDGVLLPVLIEKIFGYIPSKIVFEPIK